MASDVSKPHIDQTKLPKLPPNTKVSKRPITRAPIRTKATSSKGPQEIIYISSKTPFMSAITRIRKHAGHIQKRRSQSIAATSAKRNSMPLNKAKGDKILAAAIESLDRQESAAASVKSGKKGADELLVKGTGKAIEKVLAIARWLQDREAEEGLTVRLETGSWWAIDDVEMVEEEGNADLNGDDHDVQDLQESRLRNVSVLTLRVAVL